MARKVLPELAEPQFKRQAKVSKTEANLTRTDIDVVADDPTAPTREGNVREFLDQALQRFNLAVDGETYNRLEGLIDTLMVDGDGQWDDDIKGRRQRKKRPCLTINRFKPMIAHVANEQRMSRPAIQIDPVGGGADPDSAQIRQGLIRHIEVTSSAETVYDNAFERMIEKGWSWFRVVTDWESPLSHNQVIKIEGFTNDFCVYADPTAEDPTRKDMKWAFIVYDMPRGEYMAQYKGSKAAGMTNFQSIGDNASNWMSSDSVRVVEYYYIEELPGVSVRLIGGDGIWQDEIEERDGLWYKTAELEQMDAGKIPPEQVLPVPVDLDENKELITRNSFKPIPKWAKINAVEILDGDKGDDFAKNTAGREIAGKYIPLIMVSGRERMIKGQRRLEGMVRANRDAQRIYNYLASGFVEMVALAPKAPFIAAWGQIEDFKKIWDSLSEENWPYLPYKPKTQDQQLLPPPQRQDNRIAESAAGYLQGLAQFDNMLKQGFNIYDPSLGAAKSDQSGRAIAGLQARSDSANMNWMDNMRRALIYCGEVVLEMIPVIYDAKRTITIDRSNKKEQVVINREFKDQNGVIKVANDMASGKYAVTVSLGQYASKRQQAVQSLTEIAKEVPQVALALLPLILLQLDSPMASEAAEIIKRMQPPNLQEPGSPEEMKGQLDRLTQQHALLVKALDRANQIIEMKQIESSDKRYVADRQAEAQIAVIGAKLNSTEGMKALELEWQRITDEIDRHHEKVMALHDNAHEVGLEAIKAANQPEPAGATA